MIRKKVDYNFDYLPEIKERKIRWRIIPTSFIGISLMLLMFAAGALLGVIGLYTRFDFGLQNNINVTQEAINESRNENLEFNESIITERERLEQAVENLDGSIATSFSMSELSENLSKTVVSIETEDEGGNAIVFSGVVFSVNDELNESFILTSAILLEANKALPSPGITVTISGESFEGALINWDDIQDIALISVPTNELNAVQWETSTNITRSLYDNVFVASGFSSNGVLIDTSRLLDIDDSFIRIADPLALEQAGGGVFNNDGNLLAINTFFYSPLGISDAEIPFAMTREEVCSTDLVVC